MLAPPLQGHGDLAVADPTANRSQFLLRPRVRPILRLQPPGAKSSRAAILNWWRQGVMGGAKAHYDGIVA
jgi:non-heme chloroperoxidase